MLEVDDKTELVAHLNFVFDLTDIVNIEVIVTAFPTSVLLLR